LFDLALVPTLAFEVERTRLPLRLLTHQRAAAVWVIRQVPTNGPHGERFLPRLRKDGFAAFIRHGSGQFESPILNTWAE